MSGGGAVEPDPDPRRLRGSQRGIGRDFDLRSVPSFEGVAPRLVQRLGYDAGRLSVAASFDDPLPADLLDEFG